MMPPFKKTCVRIHPPGKIHKNPETVSCKILEIRIEIGGKNRRLRLKIARLKRLFGCFPPKTARERISTCRHGPVSEAKKTTFAGRGTFARGEETH